MKVRTTKLRFSLILVFLLVLAVPISGQYTIEVIETWVMSPNNESLYVRIIQPDTNIYPGEFFPAVIYVQGGINPGAMNVSGLAREGFIEVHWNAPGRVSQHPDDHRSSGEEDYNGFRGQDALKAITEYTMSLSNVVTDNVGVQTNSYGITMGAGCLARYPELGIKYLIDHEGPSSDFVTTKETWALDADTSNDQHELIHSILNHYSTYRDSSDTNRIFWSERQALTFIGLINCYYLRVQAQWDHAQPPSPDYPVFEYPPLWWAWKHTTDMADKAACGCSPWVLANHPILGNSLNARYNEQNQPAVYSGWMKDYPDEENRLVKLLAALPACDPPEPPQNVRIEPQPADEWLLSWSPNIEGDLAGYLIFAGESARRRDLLLADTVWAPDTTYLISESEYENFYAVRAFDTDNLRSDLSAAVYITAVAETPNQKQASLEIVVKNSFWHVHFNLQCAGEVRISLYDVSGQCVRSFFPQHLLVGEYNLTIERSQLPSGIYFLNFTIRPLGKAEEYSVTKKLFIIR
jgi:hypothetical protein